MVNINLYNADELTAPEWMDEELFQKILNTENNDCNVEIEQFAITPASTKCDHYASLIFRAIITYSVYDGSSVQRKHRSMVIKTMPIQEGGKKDLLGNTKPFETEVKICSETLPKIQNILNGCGEYTKLCTKYGNRDI